jgi:hypothetical protein
MFGFFECYKVPKVQNSPVFGGRMARFEHFQLFFLKKLGI